MRLKEILNDIDFELKKGSLEKEIDEIQYDSRKIEEDNLFVAVSGFELDGHQFIDQAIKKGATAVVIEKELPDYQKGISYIKVDNSRRTMALLAKNFFEDPLTEIKLIRITGTNGKTTTSYLLYNILKEYAGSSALFGTIKNVIGDQELDSIRTTPESVDLYRYFSQIQEKGVEYAVMEVSSQY